MRRLQRAENLCFLGIWLFLLVAGRTRLLRDPGTYWHTVAGEWMLDHARVLRVDLFSAAHYGQPWIPLQWLSECVMAILYRIGGIDLLLQASVLIIAAIYTWVFHRLRTAGWHWLVATAAVVLCVWASSYHFHARPHLVSIFLVGYTFALMCDIEASTIPLTRLIVLTPVMILWVNLHPGVYAGIAIVVFCIFGWIAQWLIGKPGPVTTARQAAALLGLTAILVATPILNPYGLELPRATFSVLESPAVRQLILEHVRLDPLDPRYWGILVLAGIYLWVLSKQDWRTPRIYWFVPVIMLVMGMSRVRHGPLFAICCLIAMGAMTKSSSWLRARTSDAEETQPTGELAIDASRVTGNLYLVPVTICILTITTVGMGLRVPLIGRGWAQPSVDAAPLGVLDALVETQQQMPVGTVILNDLNYGGFIIRYAPRLRVFIDDRCELHGDQGLQEYWKMISRSPELSEKFVDKYSIRLALVNRGGLLDSYLNDSGHWFSVANSTGAALYKREELPPLSIISEKFSGQFAENKP